MELRGCSQFHFITVIRGGEVMKAPNVARGTVRPKFMNIEDVYSSNDSKFHGSLAKYPTKVDRSLATPCGFHKVKTEVKIEEDDNELDFGATTLRQLKHICKSHKRKASRSVNLKTRKLEDNNLQCDIDELDLKETLGSWKRKVLMKSKVMKKGISRYSSVSSTTYNLGGRLQDKPANKALLDTRDNKMCKPLNIKVEDPEHDNSELENRRFNLGDDLGSLTSDTIEAVEHCYPAQDLGTTSVSSKSGCLDQCSHEHLMQSISIRKPICGLNQVSYEHLDYAGHKNPLISESIKFEETIKGSPAFVVDQPLGFHDSELRRDEGIADFMACDGPVETVLPESDTFNIEIDNAHLPCPFQSPPNHGASSEVCVPCASYSSCQNTGEAIESMDDNRDIEESMQRAVTNCKSLVKFDECLPSVDGMSSLANSISTAEDKQLSALDVTCEELLVSTRGPKGDCNDELINNGEASRSIDINLVTEAKATRRLVENCNVALQDKRCLSLVNSMESSHNFTSAVENQPLSILADAIAPLTCSPDIHPCNAIGQQIVSEGSEGDYENKLEQQPPERLLSARKTISPNSKERLRRAMNCAEVQDDAGILSCKEKLFFEENCMNTPSRSNLQKTRTVLTSKRMESLRMAESRSCSRQTLKKGKYERKLSVLRGSVNGPHAVSACSTSQSCWQNAIAFSQQQMVDSERLAMKLLKELQLMKEMVVDACTTSRCNTDKATVAVENAKKVEEITKRWLSMMARDCNRFCKIMELSEINGASAEKNNDEHIPDSEKCQNNLISDTKQDEEKLSPTSHKAKKIMFADEAGESLCHVRVL